MIKYQNNTISRLYGGNTPAYTLISGGTAIHGEYVQPSNTELTTLTYDTLSGIIDTKTNLNASANTGVELIYSSSDTSIATVDSNGQIAPKASGTTTITITAPTTTIGNTTYRGVQKRLQIECDAPSSYVEIISTDFIDSNYDDNLHVHAEHNEIYHQGTSYYRFTIQASGDFTYTYNKKPSGTGGEILDFEALNTEEYGGGGTDPSTTSYYTSTYNGNYNDPESGKVIVRGLPEGRYILRFYCPSYRIKVGSFYAYTRRTMSGYFTID